MLLVRTKLSPSAIHGIGLFAAENIALGREVWRFEPGFDLDKTVEEVLTLPLHIQEWIKHFGYVDIHLNRHIVAIDDARFINHTDFPNIRQDYARDVYGIDVALRNILVGEEITTDYRTIEKINWLTS
jgi:SET domain-containing protein